MAAVFESPLHMAVTRVGRLDCPEGGLLVSVEAREVIGTDVTTLNYGHHRIQATSYNASQYGRSCRGCGQRCVRCHSCQRGRANLCPAYEGFGHEWRCRPCAVPSTKFQSNPQWQCEPNAKGCSLRRGRIGGTLFLLRQSPGRTRYWCA